jgi:hypothetical protein
MNGLTVVPESPAILIPSSSVIFQITVTNVSRKAASLTITDRQAVPRHLLKSFPVASSASHIFSYPYGVTMLDGIIWSASAGGALEAEIFGVQAG